MESISAPLRAVQGEAQWFARDQRVRLLHTVAATDLRAPVLKLLMGQEFHADNRAPFVRFDDAFSRAVPGWVARSTRLFSEHEARVTAMRAVPSPVTRAGERDALASFAIDVRRIADVAPPPTAGLVIVLAPTRVADPGDWAIAVRALVTSKSLSDVRWIVVDMDTSTLDALVRDLGPLALRASALIDETALDKDVAAALDRAGAAPAGAPAHAAMGAAWPRGVTPPPRPNAVRLPPAQLKAAMIAAGISPAITPDEGHCLRRLLLRAAEALKARRGPDAVRLQREARDLCDSMGMTAESILMELILGTYLVQLNQRRLAIDTFRGAISRAETAGMKKEAAQGYLAIGSLAAVESRVHDAARAYASAGALAHDAGIALLAIEAYRLAGVYCTDVGVKVQTWMRALEIAGEMEPPAIKASSAAETARALAAVLRKNGLNAQAVQMEQQSVIFEAGPAPATGGAG